jgi:ribosomal protein L22
MAEEKDNKTPDVENEANEAPVADDAASNDETPAEAAAPKAKDAKADDAKADDAADAKSDDAADAEAGDDAADATDEADDQPEDGSKPATKKPSRRRGRSRSGAKKKDGAPARKPKPSEPILDEDGQPILVKATSKYVRTSARKARLVIDNIRGQSVPQARVTLAFTQRRAAQDVAKVLESAIANAEHNHDLDADDLHIAVAFADEGPTFKRWQPRARGRATPIMKRTAHITVVVSPTPARELDKYRKAAA